MYSFLADLVVLAHFGFVLFVVFGGLLLLRWPRVVWAHVPAAAWGALISFFGWVCPLTPLELELRRRAGQTVYDAPFVERYILPLLYPTALTRPVQIALGLLVLLVNAAVYTAVIRRRRRRAAD